MTTSDMDVAAMCHEAMERRPQEPIELFGRSWMAQGIKIEMLRGGGAIAFIDLMEVKPAVFAVSEALRTDPDAAP
jgi:hypothetical protein